MKKGATREPDSTGGRLRDVGGGLIGMPLAERVRTGVGAPQGNRMKSKLASSQGDDFADRVREIKGVKVLAVCLQEADPKTLREATDKFKNKFKSCVTMLAAVEDGKVKLIAGVTSDLTARLKAGDLVNFVAQQVGGKGGGRADLAQAGGTVPDSLPAALESVASWVEQHL